MLCLVNAVVFALIASVWFVGLARAAPGDGMASDVTPVASPVTQVTSVFTFTAAGDYGASRNTTAALRLMARSGADFNLGLGDLSYSAITPESAWCDYVKAHMGDTFPFQIVAGNHEDSPGDNGFIDYFAACLPDRIGVMGQYGHRYYFDYPTASPIARFILIDPDLYRDGTQAQYCKNGEVANCSWLTARIDEAKNQDLWVIVGMNKNCITVGDKLCEISPELLNLLVGRKVDLVLQGHDHDYQRSKQLALGPACSVVPVDEYDADCVVDDGSDGVYQRGRGTVIVIDGALGVGLYRINVSDSEAGYFARWMGSNISPSHGFVRYQVSADAIQAQFVSAQGSFTDTFAVNLNSPFSTATATPASISTPLLTPSLPSPFALLTPPPSSSLPSSLPTRVVSSFNPLADAYVSADEPTYNYGDLTSLRMDGSPIVRSYLRFHVQGLAGSVLSARLRIYANSGSSTGYAVHRALSNLWTETGITYSNAPALGVLAGSFGRFDSDTWTEVDVTSLVNGDGFLSLVLKGLNGTAISLSSREGPNPPVLVVTTNVSIPVVTPFPTSNGG